MVGDSVNASLLLTAATADGEIGVRGPWAPTKPFSGETFLMLRPSVNEGISIEDEGVEVVPWNPVGDGCGMERCWTSRGKKSVDEDRQRPIEDLERAMPIPEGLSRGRRRFLCCSATATRVNCGRSLFRLAMTTSTESTRSGGQELTRESAGCPGQMDGSILLLERFSESMEVPATREGLNDVPRRDDGDEERAVPTVVDPDIMDPEPAIMDELKKGL